MELSPRAKVIVLIGTMLGLFVSAVNQTVVTTALPRIIGELGGLSLFSWVFTAYMLTSTITVPLVGKLGDMYGRKPFFLAGIVVFMVATALAGLSQNMTQLIIFRGLQGFGGGALMASAFAIIGDLFPPSERGKYTGMFTAVFGLASIIGPLLGGWITDNLSWRWVFYVNIPFGVVALTVLWFGFPWVRPERGQNKIDYFGMAALTAAVVPLLLALVWGGDLYAWGSPQIAALFVIAGGGLVAFIYAESQAAEPVIPLELFKNRIFVVASAITFLMGIGMFGAITYMPMFIQGVLGASATRSGLVTMPMMLGLVASSTITGIIVSRTGKYRLLVIAGSVVLAIGSFLLAQMSVSTTRTAATVNMVIVGVGIGIGTPILGLAMQNAVPHRLLGVVSSSSQFFRQIGGMLGVAIFGTLVTTHLRDNLRGNLPEGVAAAPPQLLEQLENPQVLLSPTALQRMEEGFAAFGDAGVRLFGETIAAMRLTLSDGLGLVFVVSFVVSIAALAVTFALPEVPLRTTIDTEEERREALPDADAPPASAPPPPQAPTAEPQPPREAVQAAETHPPPTARGRRRR